MVVPTLSWENSVHSIRIIQRNYLSNHIILTMGPVVAHKQNLKKRLLCTTDLIDCGITILLNKKSFNLELKL